MTDRRQDRLRRAYEVARLWRSLPWGIPALCLGVLAWRWGAAAAPPLGIAVALGLIALRWRGGSAWRGGLTGLVAGSLAFGILGAWCQLGSCWAPGCLLVSVTAGVVAVLFLSRGLHDGSPGFALGSLTIASLVVSMPTGLLGTAGLAVVPTLLGMGLPIAVAGRRSP